MKSVSPKEICSVFKVGEFENKAEHKRCLARLANGDEAYRSFLICVGRVGHKATEQGGCGLPPHAKAKVKSAAAPPTIVECDKLYAPGSYSSRIRWRLGTRNQRLQILDYVPVEGR
jgi:hypothetical protein